MAGPIPDPTMTMPEPSALWANGMAPEIMTTFLVAFLRNHFGDPTRIVDPIFREIPWRPDAAEPWASGPGGIAIESQDAWRPGLVEQRPALLVKDHKLAPTRRGVADRLEGSRSGDGFDRYATELNSSNTVLCIAGTSRAAKRLATEVTRELVQFSDVIRRELCLNRFMVLERDDTGKLVESQAHFATPVALAWQTMESWVVRQQTVPLAKIITDVQAELARP